MPISQQVTLLTASFSYFVHLIYRPVFGPRAVPCSFTFAGSSCWQICWEDWVYLHSLGDLTQGFGFKSHVLRSVSSWDLSTLKSNTCLPIQFNRIKNRISNLTCPDQILNFPSSSSPCQVSGNFLPELRTLIHPQIHFHLIQANRSCSFPLPP